MKYDTWKTSLLTYFPNAQERKPGSFQCRCPAHDDKQASLSLTFTSDKALLRCFAGCSVNDIANKQGFAISDLFYRENGYSSHKKEQSPNYESGIDFEKPTKIYSYTDENGQELYQNCRYEYDKSGRKLEKKTFRQRKRQGDRWIYSLNGIRRVPYNFQALLVETSVIYDCEGEKDACTLIDMGLTATSTIKEAFGELPKYCPGKIICICEDNDKPGREKAKEKAEAYWAAGAIVKIMSFRDMPEKSDVTDWIQTDPESHDIFALQTRLLELPEYSPLDPLRVTFAHEKRAQTTILEIDGRRALPIGSIGGLTAGIGRGKSHFLQIIAAEAIAPGCEPESRVSVHLENGEKVVLVDTEQTRDDCYDVLTRMLSRCGGGLTHDGLSFAQFDVLSMIDLEFAERREKLTLVLTRPEIRLILLDGLLDFIANPNDPTEGTNFIVWLFTMAAKYDKAIFCTIHGNRGDENGKAKGWIGDVFQRKATCFLLLRKHKQDPDVRVITTEFENVKMRHGKDSDLNIAMRWDNDLPGFSCIDYPPEAEGKMSKDYIFSLCFEQAEKSLFTKKDLLNAYVTTAKVSQQTAYRHIQNAVNAGILIIENMGGTDFYILADPL